MSEDPCLWSVVVGGARGSRSGVDRSPGRCKLQGLGRSSANRMTAVVTLWAHRKRIDGWSLWADSGAPDSAAARPEGEVLRGFMARGPCSSAACWTRATRGCPWRSCPAKSTDPVGGHQWADVCLWRRPLDEQRRREVGRAACGRSRRGGDGQGPRRALRAVLASPGGPGGAGPGREVSEWVYSAGVWGA
jgi:hypothetical protein